jgi:hypothetical protein
MEKWNIGTMEYWNIGPAEKKIWRNGDSGTPRSGEKDETGEGMKRRNGDK